MKPIKEQINKGAGRLRDTAPEALQRSRSRSKKEGKKRNVRKKEEEERKRREEEERATAATAE